MPNHITNNIEAIHEDPKKIKWLRSCFDDKDTLDFNKIIPEPDNMFRGNLGAKEEAECKEKNIPTWYEWHYKYWGTKWKAYDGGIRHESSACIAFHFLSAWAPPQPIIDKLMAMGFTICGLWKDEGDSEVIAFNEDCGNWMSEVSFDYYVRPSLRRSEGEVKAQAYQS